MQSPSRMLTCLPYSSLKASLLYLITKPSIIWDSRDHLTLIFEQHLIQEVRVRNLPLIKRDRQFI